MKDMRDFVEKFYSDAAKAPDSGLCCPTANPPELADHIPPEVMEVSYGCGSPVALAQVAEGETVVDLGSGGGVDCFIAARLVGPGGRVVGVDMTDDMLERAGAAAPKVAENLGFSVVEFRKGFLEEVPVEDSFADLVTSNCVINLSSRKDRVMEEVFRVLKPGGRICISDVVAEKTVPEDIKADKVLWGECISGALTEGEFLEAAREAGLQGLAIASRAPYREVRGVRFDSVVLTGYKYEKGGECVYKGHRAVYNGPYSSVEDDQGHRFPRGEAVEVCTDTAEMLTRPPYRGSFTVLEPGGEAVETPCCGDDAADAAPEGKKGTGCC